MRAEDLFLEELLHCSEGVFSLHGRHLVLHDIHAFAHLRKELLQLLGPDKARGVLTRFGHYWGYADAAAMDRIFQWDSLHEWIMAGPRMLFLQGDAQTTVKKLEVDQGTGRFYMQIQRHTPPETRKYLSEYEPEEAPNCAAWCGYFSGYMSFCMGKGIYFLESGCLQEGQRACVAEGRDVDSWDPQLHPRLRDYESEDIQRTIKRLSRNLKRRNQRRAQALQRAGGVHADEGDFFLDVRSQAFQKILDMAQRVARFDSSVLITGETGTGKEVLARYIHQHSERKAKPFLGINCGALPESLLESELFGHCAGAFTDATHDRKGLFEEANQGTIFLDEIGDITPAMQLKLLRVLQEKEIRPVGENRARKVDVRVIAATNRDIVRMADSDEFRKDLLYRLRVVEMEVPALRERGEDILALARHFVQKLARELDAPDLHLDATCLDYLLEYPWPGNVRELENAIERAVVFARDGVISPDCLPPAVLRGVAQAADQSQRLTQSLAQVERDHIQAVLASAHGNRSQAARVLGISVTTLWRKLKDQ